MARSKKSAFSLISAIMLLVDFLVKFFKAVRKLGGDEQSIYDAFTDDSKISEMAKIVVCSAKNLKLKLLKLVQSGIKAASTAFKKSFFTEGPVKFYIWNNFSNWILKNAPEEIPEYACNLSKYQLTERMYDSQILDELGQPKPFTVLEFLAVLKRLVEKQPNGEEGILLNNGYANIFYVILPDGCVVAVSVRWGSGSREWLCNASDLDDDRWYGGRCVFSRS